MPQGMMFRFATRFSTLFLIFAIPGNVRLLQATEAEPLLFGKV
jgi:hypothetical protein